MRTNTKHPRRVTDQSAPGSLDVWLALSILSAGEDIEDRAAIKLKYEDRARAMYGDVGFNFSVTISAAKAILTGEGMTSSRKSIYKKFAEQIEFPIDTYIKGEQ